MILITFSKWIKTTQFSEGKISKEFERTLEKLTLLLWFRWERETKAYIHKVLARGQGCSVLAALPRPSLPITNYKFFSTEKQAIKFNFISTGHFFKEEGAILAGGKARLLSDPSQPKKK